jgi:hypothetical protein
LGLGVPPIRIRELRLSGPGNRHCGKDDDPGVVRVAYGLGIDSSSSVGIDSFDVARVIGDVAVGNRGSVVGMFRDRVGVAIGVEDNLLSF